MYKIDGTDISLSRGDSFMLSVDTRGRVMANGCTGVLSVKAKAKDETAVLEKTALISSREMLFSFEPEDTEDLKAKTYHWSLRVTDLDGNVSTPVEDAAFIITEVV